MLFAMKILPILFFWAFAGTFGYHEIIGKQRSVELMLSTWNTRNVKENKLKHVAFPYQVGIIATLTSNWTSICGGALISQSRILTAAHCWWDGESRARKFTVVLGSTTCLSGGTRMDTNDVVVHPSWHLNYRTHDIAIVKIPSVNLSNDIQSIPLPNLSDQKEDFSGLSGVVSVYHKREMGAPNILVASSLVHEYVPIITNTECQKKLAIPIQGSHLCTAAKSGVMNCDYDSGGPLVVVWRNQRILVGIVSFLDDEDCLMNRNLPSVYTRVTDFLPWINANL